MTSSTVTVSNSVQLAAALKAASTTKTAETIVLAAGTYSALSFSGYNPSANVTIESASATNKAVIDGLNISKSSNFTFQNLTFTDPSGSTGIIATSSSNNNVTFSSDAFVGTATTTESTVPFEGLSTSGSTNTTISNCTFQYLENGIGDAQNNGITISSNSFSDMYGDGIDNAGSSNVKILTNNFTNMALGTTEHPDCIQFWTTNQTTAGSNITIDGNTYSIGSGNAAQGIFISDQKDDLTYQNVTIENNVMVGTGWNGITLEDASNVLVENNTLQSVTSTGQLSRITVAGGVSGVIEDNKIGQLVTESISGRANTATITNNPILASINPTAAATALVSSMASVTSSATAATAVPLPQLAAYNAYLAAHPIAVAKA